MNVLRVKVGVDIGKIYGLKADSLVLGRETPDGRDGLQLLDQGISRRHAEVFRIGEMYFIRDLESRNGTFLNDEPVSEAVLRNGDQIRVGNTVLVFEDRQSQRLDSRRLVVDDAAAKQGKFAPSHTITFSTRATNTLPLDGKPPLEDASGETRSLRVLLEISHIVSEEKDPSKIFGRAAEEIGKTLKADNVFILALAPGAEATGEFRVAARYDRAEDCEDASVSQSIIRDCLEFNRSVLTADAGLDNRFNAMASVVMGGIRSVMCVPIASLGRKLGVLYISNTRKSEAFNADDLEMSSGAGIQLGITMQLLDLIHKSDQFFRNSITALVAAIEMRDPSRKGSAKRLATYCMAMARELGWGAHQIRNAWLVGMLHDIGSIPLTDEDRAAKFLLETRRNFYAKEILKANPRLEELIPAILLQGERWDGSGSPEGKRGDDIPHLSRVLGLAIEFDRLLVSGGPGGKELTVKEALLKAKDLADRQFDRATVNSLLIAYRNGTLFNEEAGFLSTHTEG